MKRSGVERGGAKKSTAGEIIQARLLILQSKRLMLNFCQGRLEAVGTQELRQRVERLRADTESAQHQYRSALLLWGSPENADYWVVAYSRLIEMGNVVSGKLRRAVRELPVSERYEASADVEALEEIVSKWSERMRAAMAEAVA